MAHASLPNEYWAEAISTAAYLRNRATTSDITRLHMKSGMNENQIYIILKFLAAWRMLIYRMLKDESWTKRQRSCVWLATARTPKGIGSLMRNYGKLSEKRCNI